MSQTEMLAEANERRRSGTAALEEVGKSLGERPADHDAPRLEPWLLVSLLAIAPMIVAFAIPKALVVFAAAISGILLVVGLAMLVVQERRR
jgi:hypothetical protein